MRSTLIIILFTLTWFTTIAQTIRIEGVVKDQTDSAALTGANVQLKSLPDSITIGVSTTDVDGKFAFTEVKSGSYLVVASFIGYKNYKRAIEVGINPIVNIPVMLAGDGITLSGVEIIGKTPPVTQKGDTSEIRANQFKVNPDATAEDLVTKMPGISRGTDGKISAQGEEVKRVMVDGAMFFGNDPSATLKNLPAEMIDKIQVYDRASDQAQFTGISDGNEEKTINIITKPDFRQGQFGRVFAGYAPDDKYKAGGVFNSFNKQKRLTIIGQSNNINEQNFASEDMSAMQTTGGGGGGRGPGGGGGGPRGGGGPGMGGGGNPFQTNSSGGIVTTHALGINYTDKWADKVTFQGSVFGNFSGTDLLQSTFTQYYTNQNGRDSVNSNRDATNLRFNARVTYDIDSSQSIIYSPSFSYGFNTSLYRTEAQIFRENQLQSQNINQSNSDGKNTTFNNELMYRKRLNRAGRSVQLRLNQQFTNTLPSTDQDLYTVSYDSVTIELVDKQYVESNNYNRSYSVDIDYTEPLDKKNSLILGYNYSIKNNDINKYTYDVDNGDAPSDANLIQQLSNVTDNFYNSHRPKLDYRYQNKDFNFSAGVGYQYSYLRTDKTYPTSEVDNQPFSNILPQASIRYNMGKTKNIRLFYRASTQEPSVSQLQRVIDNSNTLELTSGNPDLDQSTSHRLFFRYSSINTKTGSNFFVGGGASTTSEYISNQVWNASQDTLISGYGTLVRGGQYSYPINLDGYYNARAFGSYGFPFYLIKSNVNFNVNASYTNAPSRINQLTNNSKTANYGGGVSITSNFSQFIDFSLSTDLSYSDVKNDVNVSSDNKYFRQILTGKINWIFLKHFVINTDASYYNNQGLSSDADVSYTLWNAGLGYKFLNKNAAELRLQVFDILNSNTAIIRNFSDTYYEDVSSNVLNRYFMLMFSYKF